MLIKQVVEKPDGSVTFQANLEGPELAFVLEVGINMLMKEGSLPFVANQTHNPASIIHAVPAEQ